MNNIDINLVASIRALKMSRFDVINDIKMNKVHI